MTTVRHLTGMTFIFVVVPGTWLLFLGWALGGLLGLVVLGVLVVALGFAVVTA